MESPIQKSIELFKREYPHKVFIYDTMIEGYPDFNPLAIIDTAINWFDGNFMASSSICCHCNKNQNDLIMTIVKGSPAKYCSLDCLQYSV
jgi:hypothetical protein